MAVRLGHVPVWAQATSPEQLLTHLFTAKQLDASWFSPALLQRVSCVRSLGEHNGGRPGYATPTVGTAGDDRSGAACGAAGRVVESIGRARHRNQAGPRPWAAPAQTRSGRCSCALQRAV